MINFRKFAKPLLSLAFCTQAQEPAWMRFFKGFQQIEINIDRSLKNSNVSIASSS